MVSFELEAIVKFVRESGPLQSRLRELSHRTLHDFPAFCPAISSLTEVQILQGLELLEQQGLLTSTLEVHAFDSSEYIITWALAIPQSIRQPIA